jgi:AbrB family looped-hinge helix DNA binding protein
MVTLVVKLQKIGNSIRATIPKEIVENLALKEGDHMVVATIDGAIFLRRKRSSRSLSDKPSRFSGILKDKTGEVKHWPSPEEIKSIWE